VDLAWTHWLVIGFPTLVVLFFVWPFIDRKLRAHRDRKIRRIP